ncbi:phosphoadenylyl-sulfate reductase [Aquidulcibacter paucihalophilus]|uniref:phosphoadenylyl-sulfate reductase n=1 Tax=Aquidulcibacter paucihalophilus TaxID=1978549 RepID=UPI000A18B249|nr:phosphoadenylyl-sulfate reductase [Aquidulcibacter paucihalophilus]
MILLDQSEKRVTFQADPKRLATLVVQLEASLGAIGAPGRAALASSLSAEDMVLTDVIARLGLNIDIFTLQTGRLHPDTVAMIARTEARYGLTIHQFEPEADALVDFVATHGLNGFYESLEARKACCGVRKLEPLRRALRGYDAWVTGQRREQALTRTQLDEREEDTAHDLVKYNPLAAWSWTDVLAYAEQFQVPLNPLHARGYVSIGCDPCTRAIRPGEHARDGRWWWENADSKECGLHQNNHNKDTIA